MRPSGAEPVQGEVAPAVPWRGQAVEAVMQQDAPSDGGRVGILDIGSNSIRLVVYDSLSRSPATLFNEKALCGLGRGLEGSGRLHPDGVRAAMETLRRFAVLARAQGVGRIDILATAAVRDAADGHAFSQAVEALLGAPVQVIGGDEEARLSALGVLSGTPDADGLAGDLGGASVELSELAHRGVGMRATLPLGPLRLREAAGGDLDRAGQIIDRHLAGLHWLTRIAGRTIYPVGGAWRALARLHMAESGYPLHVIHHYAIGGSDAAEFLPRVAGLPLKTLERMAGVNRRRVETLPLAALLLARIAAVAQPAQLVLSALGLREGRLYDMLDPVERERDPLLVACGDILRQSGRFALDSEEVLRWVAPLFSNPATARLRRAAVLVSEVASREHPDYRGEIAFFRVLRMASVAMTHAERAYLALAAASRYEGSNVPGYATPYLPLLNPAQQLEARRLGVALRLAYTLSGGAPGVLPLVALSIRDRKLVLVAEPEGGALVNDTVRRRLETVAVLTGVPAMVETRTG